MNNVGTVIKGLAGAFSLAAVAPFVAFWGRMPEPMASQWSFSGSPVSALPRAVVFGLVLTLAFGAVFVLFRALRRAGASPDVSSAVGAGLAMTLLAAELSWASVLCNLDAPAWQLAAPLPLPMVMAMLAAGAAAAILGRRYARLLDAVVRVEDLPSAGIGPGRTAVFMGSATAPLWNLGALVFVCIGVAVTLGASVLVGGSLILTGLVFVPFSSLRVRAGLSGVHIEYGPFQWPRQHVDMERIVSADAIDLRPLEHGGWGYRGSLNLMGKAAIVIRGGDALDLRLTNGQRLIITVDDARTAAGLINDLKSHTGQASRAG